MKYSELFRGSPAVLKRNISGCLHAFCLNLCLIIKCMCLKLMLKCVNKCWYFPFSVDSDFSSNDSYFKVFLLISVSEDQVNFRGFMKTLAHFRPVEDNEKNKDATAGEPLNSRMNKLLCEFFSNT